MGRLIDILKQYANSAVPPTGDVFGHFDTVAQQAPSKDLGSGIAAAMRSNATPHSAKLSGVCSSNQILNKKREFLMN